MNREPPKKNLTLSRRWTDQERAKLWELKLCPHIPRGRTWPSDPPALFDLIGRFAPQIGGALAEAKAFCTWINVPYSLWPVDEWRWCFELRYRYGSVSALSLIDAEWRAQIDAAVEKSLAEFTNKAFENAVDVAGKPGSLILAAREYAYARAAGEISPTHPLNQPLREEGFWRRLSQDVPGIYGSQDVIKYINVRDGEYNWLIGRIIYLIHGLEDWTSGKTVARFPELGDTHGIPAGVDFSEMLSLRDIALLAPRYQERLGVPHRVFVELTRVWTHFALENLLETNDPRGQVVRLADAILRRLRPDIHGAHLEWVNQLRKQVIRPLMDQKNRDVLFWASKLKGIMGTLDVDPLLNCVLYAASLPMPWVSAKTSRSRGRPAEHATGKMCAFVVDALSESCPFGNSQPVGSLVNGLDLSGYVKKSVPKGRRTSLYALATPILSALFQRYITTEQVESKARAYMEKMKRDKDDLLLISLVGDDRLKNPPELQ